MTKIILKRKTNEEFSEIIIDEAKMYKYFNKNLHFFKYRSIENDEFKCIRLSMNWNNINFIINEFQKEVLFAFFPRLHFKNTFQTSVFERSLSLLTETSF